MKNRQDVGGAAGWSQTLCMIRVKRTSRSRNGHLLNRDRRKIRISIKGVVAGNRILRFCSRSSKKVRCSTVDSTLAPEVAKTLRSRRTTPLMKIWTFSVRLQIEDSVAQAKFK